MMATVVEFESVSKRFIIHHERPRSFQELAVSFFKRNNASWEELWALKDVSFAVEGGQTLGIIGPNGSGKSTLLKLITRILEPTSGRIAVNGKVSALIELGAGFHPDLTGRENVFLNGSLLGMSRKEMEEKFEEIVEFTELGRFIDMPLKHYSSGMQMRLGFAIATSVDPDILLIDEVLAVGDEAFQRKCLGKIAEFKRRGKTIVFVSHDLDAVREICDSAIWLDYGEIKSAGNCEKVINMYLEDLSLNKSKARKESRLGNAIETSQVAIRPHKLDVNKVSQRATVIKSESAIKADQTITGDKEKLGRRWGTGEIRITKVEMFGADGVSRWEFAPNEQITIRLSYFATVPIHDPIFSILIHRDDGLYVSSTNTYKIDPLRIDRVFGNGFVEVKIDSLALYGGTYYLSVGAYTEPDEPLWSQPADFHDRMYKFTICSHSPAHGVVVLPAKWAHYSKHGI